MKKVLTDKIKSAIINLSMRGREFRDGNLASEEKQKRETLNPTLPREENTSFRFSQKPIALKENRKKSEKK